MRILISGSHGLIGTELIKELKKNGDQVFRLVRKEAGRENEIFWNPENQILDAKKLENFDVIIHLGGVNIAERRWSTAFKKLLTESRVVSTSLLSSAINKLNNPPRVFLAASAVGYYGDRSDETLTEESAPGKGFLPELALKWEAASAPAKDCVKRVVNLRFGIVLSKKGGALAKMLLPFQLGLGGNLGNGKHYFSWIALEDAVNAIMHVISNENINGPVNIVSPNPVTNADFTKKLAAALKRPAFLPVPRIAVRMLLGEIADQGLFASVKVIPQKLLNSGFQFDSPEVGDALKKTLK